MPFDPSLVFRGSEDRLVDSLLLTCSALTRHRLLKEDCGSTMVCQYSKVSPCFRQKWLSLSKDIPVLDGIPNLWISYPFWQSRAELIDVKHLLFSGAIRS